MLWPFGSSFRRYFFSSIPSHYASLTMMTYGTQRNLEKYEIIPYCFLLFLIVSHVSLLFPTFPYCPYRSLPTILLLFLLSLLPLLFRSVPYIPYCSPLSPIVPTVPYCFLLSPNVSYYPPLFPAIPHCFLLSPIVSYTVPLLHPTVPYSSFFFVVPLFPVLFMLFRPFHFGQIKRQLKISKSKRMNLR